MTTTTQFTITYKLQPFYKPHSLTLVEGERSFITLAGGKVSENLATREGESSKSAKKPHIVIDSQIRRMSCLELGIFLTLRE